MPRRPASDPKFSPDGKYLSYVRGHNLYARPISGGAEVALTKASDPNLLNGEVDWLYSEELDVRSNYFWSPDARQILYLQMNEAPVPQYPIVDWIPTHPETDQERYPQAGDPNPTVKLMLTGLDGVATEIDLGVKGDFLHSPLWLGAAWAGLGHGTEPGAERAGVVLHRRAQRESRGGCWLTATPTTSSCTIPWAAARTRACAFSTPAAGFFG